MKIHICERCGKRLLIKGGDGIHTCTPLKILGFRLKFRPICGGLDESMSQIFEFTTLNELIEHLLKKWKGVIDFDFSKVEFEYKCWDARIGWETYFITCEGSPIGYSNGIPKDRRKNERSFCGN